MHSKTVPRRQHSAELKAKVVAACAQPGASISGVALAHGLNANLVRKWLTGRGLKRASLAAESHPVSVPPRRPVPTASPRRGAKPEFIAIEMPHKATVSTVGGNSDAAPAVDPLIHIELRRGPLHLSVRWPSSAAEDCSAWLRALSMGLLK